MDTTCTTSTTQTMRPAPAQGWQGTPPGASTRGRRNSAGRQWSPVAAQDRAGSRLDAPLAAPLAASGIPDSSEDMSWPCQCERLSHFNQ